MNQRQQLGEAGLGRCCTKADAQAGHQVELALFVLRSWACVA
jgi:hypothetical protein